MACLRDEHCVRGTCAMGGCVPWCEPDRGCGEGQTCCSRSCADLMNNPMHCGACDRPCTSAPHAAASCSGGRCSFRCDEGFSDCNMNPADGCESDLRTSPTACGACGMSCPTAPNASAACAGGACSVTCNMGFANCNVRMDDGCESDTRSSVAHCGACGTTCSARPNSMATCALGMCRQSCVSGYADCNGRSDDDCEVNLLEDVAHCGVCTRTCALLEGCSAGECRIANLVGYWPFDGNGTDRAGGRTLTLVGGATFGAGLFGQALDLRGDATRYATRPGDDDALDFGTSDFSVQAWVNYYNTDSQQVLVEKFVGTRGPGWTIVKQPGYMHWYASPSAVMDSPAVTIPLGVWHHMLIRRRGSDFTIFYDGTMIQSTTNTSPVPDTTGPLLVGRRNAEDPRSGFPLNGRLDELAIWSRALTDVEIRALYNDRMGRPILP